MNAQQVTDSRTPRRRRSFAEAFDGLDAETRGGSRRILASLAGQHGDVIGMEVVA